MSIVSHNNPTYNINTNWVNVHRRHYIEVRNPSREVKELMKNRPTYFTSMNDTYHFQVNEYGMQYTNYGLCIENMILTLLVVHGYPARFTQDELDHISNSINCTDQSEEHLVISLDD